MGLKRCDIIPRKFHLQNTFYQNMGKPFNSWWHIDGSMRSWECNHSKICHRHVGWLVNSHWDKLGGAKQPSIYLLSSCHSNSVSFITRSTFAASWHACLTLLVAIFLSNSKWRGTTLSTVLVPKNFTFSLSASRLWGHHQTHDWHLQCFWRSLRLLRVFCWRWWPCCLFALEDNKCWKAWSQVQMEQWPLEGPMNFCTSADRSFSSLSASSFLICVSMGG